MMSSRVEGKENPAARDVKSSINQPSVKCPLATNQNQNEIKNPNTFNIRPAPKMAPPGTSANAQKPNAAQSSTSSGSAGGGMAPQGKDKKPWSLVKNNLN